MLKEGARKHGTFFFASFTYPIIEIIGNPVMGGQTRNVGSNPTHCATVKRR